MQGTKQERERRRIERWFKRTGPMVNVSDEAFDLLGRRLSARTRAGLTCSPLVLLACAVYASALFEFPSTFSDAAQERWSKVFAGRTLITFALLAICWLLTNRLTSRAEQWIGVSLPRRTSRGSAVPLRSMLGRARMSILVATITLEAALLVPLFALGYGWFAWWFLAAYLGALALTTLGLRQASTRATVAMDPSSLAIDERLRSDDSFRATNPLSSLIVAFPALGLSGGPSGFILVWGFAGAIILLMNSLGIYIHPWQQPVRRLNEAERSAFIGINGR
jgi:hypothetical protein